LSNCLEELEDHPANEKSTPPASPSVPPDLGRIRKALGCEFSDLPGVVSVITFHLETFSK